MNKVFISIKRQFAPLPLTTVEFNKYIFIARKYNKMVSFLFFAYTKALFSFHTTHSSLAEKGVDPT